MLILQHWVNEKKRNIEYCVTRNETNITIVQEDLYRSSVILSSAHDTRKKILVVESNLTEIRQKRTEELFQ